MYQPKRRKQMNVYYVEIMSNSYKWEPKIEFSAADDRAAFAQACEIATKRPGCIAFSVSHRVGKKTVYIAGV